MTDQQMQTIKPPREDGAAQVTDLTVPSFADRFMQGASYIFRGRIPEWFGPRAPLPPQAPEGVGGRQLDYPVGINLNYVPKTGEGITFGTLRNLADTWDLLRIILETQKDRLCQMRWNIVRKDNKASTPRCQEIEKWLAMPDKEHTWSEWLRMILEDMLVLDAPCIYPRPAMDGTLYALEPVDGSTIKRILDDSGRTPMPLDAAGNEVPAYQQILKGLPAANFTRDQLIYRPRNPRTSKVYGYSQVEQVLVTINLALQRQASMINYYSDGSTPDLILSVPESWTPEQIAKFKIWWDAILKGNTAARRGTMFVFKGTDTVNTKDKLFVDKVDEWLARVICFCFGMSAQPFIQQNNRAAAVSAATQAKEEGLGPGMAWITDLMNFIICKYFGETELRFMFRKDQETDPLTRSQTCNLKVRAGAMSINEWRNADGEEPIEGGDKPMIYTGSAVIPLDKAVAGEAMPNAGAVDEGADGQPGQNGRARSAAAGSNRQQAGPTTRTQNKKPPSRTVNDGAGKMTKAAARPITRTEVHLANEIAMVLRGMESATLAGIVHQGILRGRTADIVLEGVQASSSGLKAPLIKALTDQIVHGYAAATAAVLQKASGGPPLVNADASAYAAARAASLVAQVDESTRLMIRRTIAQAIEEEWTTAELAKALAAEYAFSPERAATIASTEMNDALTHAELEAWQATGIVKAIQWVVADDEKVCDICTGNEADGPVELGKEFSSGDDGPPAHPNCRCSLQALTDEDFP